jgi:chromate transporter
MMALAQAAPGLLAVNSAIFLGHRLCGWRGVAVCVTGAVLPSFVVILLIAMCFSRYKNLPAVEAVFRCIRPAVVALIAVPTFRMAQRAKIGWSNCWIPISSTLLIWLLGVSPAWIILIAGLGGFCYGWILNRGKSRE